MKDSQKLDNYILRYKSRNLFHDTKINIRINSVLEVCKYIFYFLIVSQKKVVMLQC